MLGKIPATRLALIEKIVTHALKGLPRARHALAREFLGGFFRGVAEEDLRAHRPADLAAAALAHLEFGRRRTGDEARVDIAPPLNVDAPTASHRALLRVVTPDMPFLVDSIGIVFSQMNIAVHLIVHPVLAVRRDARGTLKAVGVDRQDAKLESWQMMEIDRPRDAAAARELEQRVRAALEDVRRAVTDFRAMLERIRAVANELERAPLPVPRSHASEARALLAWMHDGHFVFLGYRHYQLRRGRSRDALVRDSASGLGILREPASTRKGSYEPPPPIVLTGHLRQQARAPELLLLTKANTPSTVHRGSYLDYVGVKTFDASGQVSGEHRFLGLWTSSAYHKPPAEIPLLRRKLEAVIAHFGLPAQSHDAKSVVNVIETFPRDELFQTPLSELIASVRGIVNLYERRRVRLFVRRDSFERFYSCLVYVPRDRYNTEVRERIERIVRQRFGGTHVETQVQISDSMLARLHMLVRTQQGARPVENIQAIEAEIAVAAMTWEDRLQQALISRGVERSAVELAARYAKSFPPAYRADVEPAQALDDIADLEALAADPTKPQINLRTRTNGDASDKRGGRLSLRILQLSEPISISDILPMLENFGLRVLAERPYQVTTAENTVWIQDFELEAHDLRRADIAALEPLFKEAFLAAWRGDIENDGFNRLLLCASLSARDIVVVRAYCRYLLQTGIPFSQAYMERVLVAQAPITSALVRLFQTQFALNNRARESAAERTAKGILRALDKVASLDEDRILRSYLNVIRATLRTNYFQTMDGTANGKPKSWVSFKLDPHAIPDLPLPRPKFEIFVYSPRVEGVHMRMGYVARGGLRWSDRREDFRTEVLGLMKAQHVKNTVIVPVGAKGGFYPKRLPAGGTREDIQKEVVASYQTFIRGLLDVTDNFVNGKIAVRPGIVRRDGDDAYLVVAADKGTATFSDIANAISIEYGHWLGDAFASGGSAGYDHKGMGITARGAWECVKRHFRELGVDIQSQEFSCAGVGDMSGDVFGNGMLLSKQTRLVAAFDHRHIFLDPNPEAAAGFRERERLFKLPRSSWDDYSRKLISRGGGVWPRSAKSIPLTAEAQKLLDLTLPAATPVEVMRAILRMRVDLLWNGGIGTYVKATDESHAEVRDRANDAIRADGREIRARVVGEGGNLGCTQRGRVEYSQSGGSDKSGGRINTDFIDNSAGVNTSDVEVNIKILLSEVQRRGRLTVAARNKLLASMTHEVASLVLRNNYLQTQALSVLEQRAPERLAEYQSLIRELERNGNLDRAIEFLPADDEFLERRKQRLGLTRPELAVVLAYSKIWLSNHLLDSDLPDDPYFASEVQRYFPAPMRKRYSREITRHRLRREIVATATTNSLVNRMGPVFVARAQEETEADPAAISRAYTIAREIFSMRSIWADIESLDNQVAAEVQYGMFFRTSRLLRHTSYWLLREKAGDLHIDNAVRELRAGVEQLTDCIDAVIGGEARTQRDATFAGFVAGGVPDKLARRVARLSMLEPALDIVALARAEHMPVADVARAYFELGVLLGLDWLHGEIDRLVVDGSWQATARSGLRDAAMRAHRDLAHQVLNTRGPKRAGERVASWSAQRAEALASWQRTLTEMRAVGSTDFATLTVGVEAVRGLSSG
ncbi:MAG TPA: NAD-glutamate dehydrogenase [Steroidobacteraceae bacterium]|nr:NAD-glutamate dehydrogenase [Steroidobacteraceae bacterium]